MPVRIEITFECEDCGHSVSMGSRMNVRDLEMDEDSLISEKFGDPEDSFLKEWEPLPGSQTILCPSCKRKRTMRKDSMEAVRHTVPTGDVS